MNTSHPDQVVSKDVEHYHQENIAALSFGLELASSN